MEKACEEYIEVCDLGMNTVRIRRLRLTFATLFVCSAIVAGIESAIEIWINAAWLTLLNI